MREPADPVAALLAPFRRRGGDAYLGEDVTQAAHALQTAALADASGAPESLVVAALLHDVGWLAGDTRGEHDDDGDDPGDRAADHAARGAAFLAQWLPLTVTEPVRLHVEAKRWLCATDARYGDRLSEASKRTLALQGGPMGRLEVSRWLERPWSADAVTLRRLDDQAKEPGRQVPDIVRWVPLVRRLVNGTAVAGPLGSPDPPP